MVSNRFCILVRVFISLCLLAFSLSASSADSESFLSHDLKTANQITAPEIDLSDVNKQPVTISYTKKITLVHFWASWCLPCREELPLIEELQKTYSDNPQFQIITIAADSHQNIRQYVQSNNIKSPVVIDQYGKLLRSFNVKALPSSYLINQQGQIEYQAATALDWSSLKIKSKIDALLMDSAVK